MAKRMTKMEALHEAERLGSSFIANVIFCHYSNPAKKLRGLVNLLHAGHTVTLLRGLDDLLIDGYSASWVVLEEWANRYEKPLAKEVL